MLLDAAEDCCYTCIAVGKNMLAIRLSPEIEKRLEDLAKKQEERKPFMPGRQ